MRMHVIVLSAVLANASLSAPARAAQAFDGHWSVEVITEKGTCDQAYRWDISIEDGHIVTTPDMPAQATGAVTPHGAVNVSFSRGTDVMKAVGSASGNWASGEWTAPSKACSGRWRAERRA